MSISSSLSASYRMQTLSICYLSAYFGLVLSACESTDQKAQATKSDCSEGITETTDLQGYVTERTLTTQVQNRCFNQNLKLTVWQERRLLRRNRNIVCTPQPELPSLTLISGNNYYSYRNQRILLQLDSATGIARRLVLGELPNGENAFFRDEFCYFVRTDIETEPTRSVDYGQMLFFDLAQAASSREVSHGEMFSYNLATDGSLELQMLNNNNGVEWNWCPENTPWGFCDYMKNGNEYYYPPDPPPALAASLLNETLLIRSQMNFVPLARDEFELLWTNPSRLGHEVGTTDYVLLGGRFKYQVAPWWDEPKFVGQSWAEYMRRKRPSMPDVKGSVGLSGRLICYDSLREIVGQDGGRTFLRGETCVRPDGTTSFNGFD